jgi:glycosyltransferase involved in cell wall biosynthesis
MKVSIITINRNNKVGLHETIESVLSQSFLDYEYIIVDGASTDGSVKIIKEYSDKVHQWISEPDSGVYEAMNKGIRMSHGEYCIFMNSGDTFASPSVLQNIFSENPTADILAGTSEENSTQKIVPPPSLHFRYLFHNNISHQAEFIKRSLFASIGYYSENLKILSDYEFNIKASLSGATYSVLPMTVAVVEPGGLSASLVDQIDKERDIIFQRLFPSSILDDYLFWLDQSTYSHPFVEWIVNRPFLMKLLKRLLRL